jgi:hypothetical protein
MKDYRTKTSWVWNKFLELMGTPCVKELDKLQENTGKVLKVIDRANDNRPKVGTTVPQ